MQNNHIVVFFTLFFRHYAMRRAMQISSRGTLGTYVYKLRKERIGSQKDLARMVGVSPAYISEVETGKAMPSRELLWKMADVLGIKRFFLVNMSQIQKMNDFKAKTARRQELVNEAT